MLKVDKKSQGGLKTKRGNITSSNSEKDKTVAAPQVRPAKLDTLKSNPDTQKLIDVIEKMKSKPEHDSPSKQNAMRVSQVGKKVAFVAPILPHHCELEICNDAVQQTGVTGVVLTAAHEAKSFQTFVDTCNYANIPIALTCKTLETTLENKSFLGGLENEISDASVVVAVGEASL